jgi:hypothetical protein
MIGRIMQFVLEFLRRHWIPVVLLVAASVLLPYVQDYRQYVRQWALVLTGENPWMDLGPDRTNRYGPGHMLLALPYALHPRLPRILAAVSLIVATALALRTDGVPGEATVGSGRARDRKWLVGLTLYNPLLWISAAVIGHHDVFVALLAVCAVGIRDRRPASAGGLLAAATLLKGYPLVLSPFLATDRGLIEGRVSAGFGRGDGGIDMCPGDIPHGVDHRQDHEPEGESDPHVADRATGDLIDHDRPGPGKDQAVRPEKLTTGLLQQCHNVRPQLRIARISRIFFSPG